jgi:NADH-quinone oxidoreductase subunit N
MKDLFIFYLLTPEIFFLIGNLILFLFLFFSSTQPYPKYVRECSIFFAFLVNIYTLFLYTLNRKISIVFFHQMFIITPYTLIFKIILLILATLVLLILFFPSSYETRWRETLFIMQVTTFGFLSSMLVANFILLYLSLELSSLGAYILAIDNSAKTRFESAIKYFFSHTVISAFFILSLVGFYDGFATFNILEIHSLSDFNFSQILSANNIFYLQCYLAYHLFKAAVVPFHLWLADVYENTTPILTAYFAVVSKCVAFYHLFAIFGVFPTAYVFISNTYWALGLFSIIIGTFSVFKQTNLKRIFAFSSLTHTGIILILISSGTREGLNLALFYFISYALGSIAFFTVLESFMNKEQSLSLGLLDHLKSLAQLKDVRGFLFSLTLFSFAGIPPLLGFFSKLFLVEYLVQEGFFLSLTIFVICTIFSTVYYLKLFLSYWSVGRLLSLFSQKLSFIEAIILYGYSILILISPIFIYWFYIFLNYFF